jgi:hypothetical protein
MSVEAKVASVQVFVRLVFELYGGKNESGAVESVPLCYTTVLPPWISSSIESCLDETLAFLYAAMFIEPMSHVEYVHEDVLLIDVFVQAASLLVSPSLSFPSVSMHRSQLMARSFAALEATRVQPNLATYAALGVLCVLQSASLSFAIPSSCGGISSFLSMLGALNLRRPRDIAAMTWGSIMSKFMEIKWRFIMEILDHVPSSGDHSHPTLGERVISLETAVALAVSCTDSLDTASRDTVNPLLRAARSIVPFLGSEHIDELQTLLRLCWFSVYENWTESTYFKSVLSTVELFILCILHFFEIYPFPSSSILLFFFV